MAAVAASSAAASGQDGDRGPRHVAIIMDGNGRWANARGLPRAAGHERGVEALRRTVEAARELGIECLTVFSFSTENWRRPVSEVNALFGLLKAYVNRDLKRLTKEGVRIRVIGSRNGLPDDVAALVGKAETETAHNTKFDLVIAFNYGGREEISRAARSLAQRCVSGEMSVEDITEDALTGALDTSMLPDPDLIIRTSGEYRLSNFLIWQSAYAELVFCDVLWPDFSAKDLADAIQCYRDRERRYGGLKTGTV